MKTKYIFITGGVVSSLGKGIAAASIGRLLLARGLKVNMLKMDPYLNVDPGTMNPYQHGEVFVTGDGAETDLDLGHYERFLGRNMRRDNNLTAGQVYDAVISNERRGEFLGKTVQVIPHVTNEIKSRIRSVSVGNDIQVVEVGGTVGDIESLPFLEAIRQMKIDLGKERVFYVHVTLVPYLKASDEMKTKPTQHSVGKLREIGIEPDVLLCRTERPLPQELREKISLFSSLPVECVIPAPDVDTIYEIPSLFAEEGLDRLILKKLGLPKRKRNMAGWDRIVDILKHPRNSVEIAVAGKYTELKDAYKSIVEALIHGGLAYDAKVKIRYVDAGREYVEAQMEGVHGILVPGGFGDRGIEGKVDVTRYAREKKIPFLGICLGMQCAVIDFAKNVAGLRKANSSEFSPRTTQPVIHLLAEQKSVTHTGGTMRLGLYPCRISPDSLAYKAYGERVVYERHRHRYEFNNKYRKRLKKYGLKVSGVYPNKRLAEIVEVVDHPWFVAVQFHPEFRSRPLRPHPLFRDFVGASLRHQNKTERKHSSLLKVHREVSRKRRSHFRNLG